MAIKLILIDPDKSQRGALLEQFIAADEFDPLAAAAPSDLAEGQASLSLHHAEVGLLCGDGVSADNLHQMRAAGFAGPIIGLGGGTVLKEELSASHDRPIRFSTLAASLRGAVHEHERSDEARFRIGPYEFQPAERVLMADGREPVRLTDKESGILRYLHRAVGRPVPREELLGEVWGYNSGVTTHTLETHIYRLRQKMEPTPEDARLLITSEGGYRLAPAD